MTYQAEQRPHDEWTGRPIVRKLPISERLAHQIQPLERQQAILTAAAARAQAWK